MDHRNPCSAMDDGPSIDQWALTRKTSSSPRPRHHSHARHLQTPGMYMTKSGRSVTRGECYSNQLPTRHERHLARYCLSMNVPSKDGPLDKQSMRQAALKQPDLCSSEEASKDCRRWARLSTTSPRMLTSSLLVSELWQLAPLANSVAPGRTRGGEQGCL